MSLVYAYFESSLQHWVGTIDSSTSPNTFYFGPLWEGNGSTVYLAPHATPAVISADNGTYYVQPYGENPAWMPPTGGPTNPPPPSNPSNPPPPPSKSSSGIAPQGSQGPLTSRLPFPDGALTQVGYMLAGDVFAPNLGPYQPGPGQDPSLLRYAFWVACVTWLTNHGLIVPNVPLEQQPYVTIPSMTSGNFVLTSAGMTQIKTVFTNYGVEYMVGPLKGLLIQSTFTVDLTKDGSNANAPTNPGKDPLWPNNPKKGGSDLLWGEDTFLWFTGASMSILAMAALTKPN